MDVVATADAGAELRFRAVFEANYPAVLHYAQRRVRADLAADVASEVFLTAWRRLADIPVPPLPWLYGVARRVVANQVRADERRARLSERVSAERRDRPDTLADAVASAASFAAAFDRLSADDREVLGLIAWEGLGAREAATALGCSVTAVTMRLHRARGRLRANLRAEEGDPT